MFLPLDIPFEYWIKLVTIGLLYVMFRLSTRIFYRGVSGFASDCPCGAWCRGLTTYHSIALSCSHQTHTSSCRSHYGSKIHVKIRVSWQRFLSNPGPKFLLEPLPRSIYLLYKIYPLFNSFILQPWRHVVSMRVTVHRAVSPQWHTTHPARPDPSAVEMVSI